MFKVICETDVNSIPLMWGN